MRGTALTKTLAVIGTLLVWFPIAAMVVTGVVGSIAAGALRVDYLMPAELLPAALMGGLALLFAAGRAHSRLMPIAWGLGVGFGALIAAQALAETTGLASGATEASGWPWYLVLGSLGLYTLALIAVGVVGIGLVRDVFGPPLDDAGTAA